MAILTVAQLRTHIAYPTGTDADAALQRLLNAAEEAILEAIGAAGALTELHTGGYLHLILSRPITTMTTVIEDVDGESLTLASDDYRFTVGGFVLERLSTGTNPRSTWLGRVSTLYTPVADTSTRELVQIELCRIFINHHPGLTSQTIGDWSETFASNSVWNYAMERDAILAQLAPPSGMVVIGG